eukprot:6192022-Pleurochrysis_carterae.AAC.1
MSVRVSVSKRACVCACACACTRVCSHLSGRASQPAAAERCTTPAPPPLWPHEPAPASAAPAPAHARVHTRESSVQGFGRQTLSHSSNSAFGRVAWVNGRTSRVAGSRSDCKV